MAQMLIVRAQSVQRLGVRTTMANIPSDKEIAHLRSDARRLSREQGRPLNQLQNELASKAGFKSWAMLMAASRLVQQQRLKFVVHRKKMPAANIEASTGRFALARVNAAIARVPQHALTDGQRRLLAVAQFGVNPNLPTHLLEPFLNAAVVRLYCKAAPRTRHRPTR